MLKKTLVGAGVALVLGSFSVVASAGTVTISGAKFGYTNVDVKNVSPGNPTFERTGVLAGGFKGSVTGFGGADGWVNSPIKDSFTTYCVEFTESFSPGEFQRSLVLGNSYLHWGLGASSPATPAGERAAISVRLGKLMSHVNGLTASSGADGATKIDSVLESSAVQLAIWEIIYETPAGVDLDVNSAVNGSFHEYRAGNQGLRDLANIYLTNSKNTNSIYDVYVLTATGSQDWLALKEGDGGDGDGGTVPEPTSLALAFGALGALGFATRRRKNIAKG